MTSTPSRDDVERIRKLAGLPDEIRQTRFVAITRLTVLKSLCREPERAHRFVVYLARRTFAAMEQPKGRPTEPTATESSHRQMMADALEGMDAWLRSPDEKTHRTLSALNGRMRDEQNAHRNMRYTPSEGTGLISSSIPFVRDIVDFWPAEYDQSAESLAPKQKSAKTEIAEIPSAVPTTFTVRQGQFLAFIHLYRKLHHRGPAESDLRAYFRVTPPAVHGMVVKLEELGLITREPGVARSMRVAVPAKRLPELKATDGPPW